MTLKIFLFVKREKSRSIIDYFYPSSHYDTLYLRPIVCIPYVYDKRAMHERKCVLHETLSSENSRTRYNPNFCI